MFTDRRGHEEGDADQVDLVGQGQVEEVKVRDCLHFGETEDDIDDQSVATESDYGRQGVQKFENIGQPCGRK